MTAPLKTVPGIQTSTGAGSAGCVVVTNGDGLVDPSFLAGATSPIYLGGNLIQFGSDVAPQPAAGVHLTSKTFTFLIPYSSPPHIYPNSRTFPITAVGGGAAMTGTSTTTTGTILFDDDDFGNIAGGINTPIDFDWIAVGPA